MNEKIEVPTMQVPPLKKICMTIGQLPASYVESMSYYEMLVWFVNYLRDDIIPVVNANGEATHELQELYVELQEYVNNYFDNLDVQEEINNKLDEMAESGELTDIIAQYLGLAGMITFNNVAEMKLAQNLVNGSKCATLGYYNVGDNGNAFYKVRTITNLDVVDEKTIIALYNENLIAELIVKDYINPEMLGSNSNGTTDDSSTIQIAINYASSHNIPLLLTKNYSIQNVLTLKNNLTIDGKGKMIFDLSNFDFDDNIFCIVTENFDDYTLTLDEFNHDITIKNITFDGINDNATMYNILGISNTINFTFDNCHFLLEEGTHYEPFDFRGGNLNTRIINCLIEDLQNNTKSHAGGPGGSTIFRQYNPDYPSSIKISNCKFIKKNADDIIFLTLLNDIEEFVVENCSFEIAKGQSLTSAPDNCLTFKTAPNPSGIPKGKVIYQNCQIFAYNFNEHLFIKNDELGGLEFVCKDSEIITGSNSVGMFALNVDFDNCNVSINHNTTKSNMNTNSNFMNCNIKINQNITGNLFNNANYLKNNIIIGNSKTCNTMASAIKNISDNIVDGLSFTNLTLNPELIINNTIKRYNQTSDYNSILYFNETKKCIANNNYFDFWGIITVNQNTEVQFINNKGYRFSLTNNGTFKNANNVGNASFVGTGWNDSGNNIVL